MDYIKFFRRLITALYVGAIALPLQAAIDGFVETFDGSGEYATVNGNISGLDSPDWQIAGDGEIVEGGYRFYNRSEPGGPPEGEVNARPVVGRGSFVSRVEIKSLYLGDMTSNNRVDSSGSIYLRSDLDPSTRGKSVISIGIQEVAFGEAQHSEWQLLYRDREYDSLWVPRGPHIAFEIRYEHPTSMFTYVYDSDLGDEFRGIEIGPFHLAGSVAQQHVPELRIRASGEAHADGLLDFWFMLPLSDIPGDFNGNGTLDAADIDQLSEQVRAGSDDPLFDINADSVLNDRDRQYWVHDLKQTYFGDADLNGVFDSTDLVQVLASGEYEDGVEFNSSWLTGDWNGDGEFTSGDLIAALGDGGYEAVAAAVPEPAGAVLPIVAAVFVTASGHRRTKTRYR